MMSAESDRAIAMAVNSVSAESNSPLWARRPIPTGLEVRCQIDHISSPHVATKAWLEGRQFDLADLAELLANGEVRVEHGDENTYYLTAARDRQAR